MSASLKRIQVEHEEGWRDIMRQIPPLRFAADWEVRMVPPFAGALVRFWVTYNGQEASIYLDHQAALGACPLVEMFRHKPTETPGTAMACLLICRGALKMVGE